jgi:hypothetical protein
MNRARTLIAFGCLAVSFSFAQGTFQNLNFESATIITNVPRVVAASNALPGWTVLDNFSGNNVFYNDIAVGSPCVSIHDRNSLYPVPLQGLYSVLLQSAPQPFTGNFIHGGISQVGTVPADAQSLQFYAVGEPSVTFGGYGISLTQIGSGQNIVILGAMSGSLIFRTNSYAIYAADVSYFAGQAGELVFRAPSSINGYGIAYLDNISFSPIPVVPEPSTLAMLGLGFASFWCLMRRKRLK